MARFSSKLKVLIIKFDIVTHFITSEMVDK